MSQRIKNWLKSQVGAADKIYKKKWIWCENCGRMTKLSVFWVDLQMMLREGKESHASRNCENAACDYTIRAKNINILDKVFIQKKKLEEYLYKLYVRT